MRACPACRRHVFAADRRCPFCGVAQRESGGPTLAVVIGLAASVNVGVTACTDRNIGDDGNDSGGATSGNDDTSTTNDPASETTPTMTSSSAGPSTSSNDVSTSVDTGDVTTDAPTSVGFIYGSASTGEPPAIECSTYLQDCPEFEKCMPWANDGGEEWNATRCSPVAPDAGQPGDPCRVEGNKWSGVDDCDVLAICWFVDDETDQGTCIGLCADDPSDPSCVDSDTVCFEPTEIVGLCAPTCDPLDPDGCPDNSVCNPGDTGGVCQ